MVHTNIPKANSEFYLPSNNNSEIDHNVSDDVSDDDKNSKRASLIINVEITPKTRTSSILKKPQQPNKAKEKFLMVPLKRNQVKSTSCWSDNDINMNIKKNNASMNIRRATFSGRRSLKFNETVICGDSDSDSTERCSLKLTMERKQRVRRSLGGKKKPALSANERFSSFYDLNSGITFISNNGDSNGDSNSDSNSNSNSIHTSHNVSKSKSNGNGNGNSGIDSVIVNNDDKQNFQSKITTKRKKRHSKTKRKFVVET
eukprot:Pgem_evm1s1938